MRNKNLEAELSLISELLLFHAALGRGYKSPFPQTKGMVFTSALPAESMAKLFAAESRIRIIHAKANAKDRERLTALESVMKAQRGDPDPGLIKDILELKERVNGIQDVTWQEDQVAKSTLVELLKRSHYGALTYIDPMGGRLAASMSSPLRLASDLTWVTLMEGTTDATLIRANATGGSLIHSLAGASTSFNYFCNCHIDTADKLLHRVASTTSGRVIAGYGIILPSKKGEPAPITEDAIFTLMEQVFLLGKEDAEKWVNVTFHPECAEKWKKFLEWGMSDLADREITDWQLERLEGAPATARTCVLFGSRAALTMAFLEKAKGGVVGACVELNINHFNMAVRMARAIFEVSSGLHKLENRARNAVKARESLLGDAKLDTARKAVMAFLEASEDGRIARTVVRNTADLTLGLVDELVRRGELVELRGVEQCQMGRTTRAYALPGGISTMSPEEAIVEFEEAEQNMKLHPDLVTTGDAYRIYGQLQAKAAVTESEHFLPVVPLSQMSGEELKALPAVLETFSESVALRGAGAPEAEPEGLVEDEDTPLDREGMNLWMRYRPDGDAFRDWAVAAKLGFQDRWAEEPAPPTVPK